jgi:hypothetical protein
VAMRPRCFVRDQNIGLLHQQCAVV